MSDRCLTHGTIGLARVWCMLDAGHDGPHRAWHRDLDAGPAAWALQWNDAASNLDSPIRPSAPFGPEAPDPQETP